MYSSSYSRAKLGLDARELHRSRGKSCGYYVKIVFFFSSLIQSLIIVSLVLFLVYGQPERNVEEKRVKDLENNLEHLGKLNLDLRKEKEDLNAQLKAKGEEKTAVEKELETAKATANTTEYELRKKVSDCERQLSQARTMRTTPVQPQVIFNPASRELSTLQTLNAQQKAMINLIEANFTQMVHYLSQERDTALKDRDTHHQDAIAQRRENSMLKDQLTVYSRKCKEDFAQSLDGIKSVTSEFLKKINNLFPHQLTFHLSCSSQAEQMEKIRNSCTNLSNDVENKFQIYLDRVGDKVAEIQAMSSRMEVMNSNLDSDLKKCERTRTENAAEATRQLELKQKTHDNQVERLLNEQNRLRGQKELQDNKLALNESELNRLKTDLANCKPGPKVGGMGPTLNKPTTVNWPPMGAPVKPPAVGLR
ncbi:plasmalemma vesicle associated protein b [Boleophthalmus pectinirostris]|uniref:plasmalemma vesicle associated protein b n=1 Tax=Boleophthalmus pectinirostris TaxID=150288 RepID=UPI000A1C668B|nr:plasmalemma vesicle associated protein b [Boleophthalmus pectinirostris]